MHDTGGISEDYIGDEITVIADVFINAWIEIHLSSHCDYSFLIALYKMLRWKIYMESLLWS